MSGKRTVSLNNKDPVDFIGESVRVITESSHYRGECLRIDPHNNNVLLRNVVKKRDTGWIDISHHMLVMGHSIETVYIEKSFPFDSNESLILSIENGSVVPESDTRLKGLDNIKELGSSEENE